LKTVLRAASGDFSNLCGDEIREEIIGGDYVRKGTLVFDGASFAECRTEDVNSENVRFSYTIFYYPSSDEDCNRKMNFLYEQLEHVLLTYKSKGRIVTEDGSYFLWESSQNLSGPEPSVKLSKRYYPGRLESQLSLEVGIMRKQMGQ
jgi:hypothetical protein